ncbi:hypothetical protein PLESTM_001666500 [Pleodorina starrii]|nr:hypothetical protein PLESTM_001666500 [Pleodorina starrii]
MILCSTPPWMECCRPSTRPFLSSLQKVLISTYNESVQAGGVPGAVPLPRPVVDPECTAVSAFTIEGLMRRWRTTPQRIICMTDEFRVFRESLGLYKQGGKGDFDVGVLLSCYNDNHFSRVLSERTENMPNVGMSVLGWTQPAHAVSFLASDSASAGLTARFLVICPKPVHDRFSNMGAFPDDLRVLPDKVPVEVREAYASSQTASQQTAGDKHAWIPGSVLFEALHAIQCLVMDHRLAHGGQLPLLLLTPDATAEYERHFDDGTEQMWAGWLKDDQNGPADIAKDRPRLLRVAGVLAMLEYGLEAAFHNVTPASEWRSLPASLYLPAAPTSARARPPTGAPPPFNPPTDAEALIHDQDARRRNTFFGVIRKFLLDAPLEKRTKGYILFNEFQKNHLAQLVPKTTARDYLSAQLRADPSLAALVEIQVYDNPANTNNSESWRIVRKVPKTEEETAVVISVLAIHTDPAKPLSLRDHILKYETEEAEFESYVGALQAARGPAGTAVEATPAPAGKRPPAVPVAGRAPRYGPAPGPSTSGVVPNRAPPLFTASQSRYTPSLQQRVGATGVDAPAAGGLPQELHYAPHHATSYGQLYQTADPSLSQNMPPSGFTPAHQFHQPPAQQPPQTYFGATGVHPLMAGGAAAGTRDLAGLPLLPPINVPPAAAAAAAVAAVEVMPNQVRAGLAAIQEEQAAACGHDDRVQAADTPAVDAQATIADPSEAVQQEQPADSQHETVGATLGRSVRTRKPPKRLQQK